MRALALTLCLALAACGTTRIIAADRNATILVNGKVEGRGTAEITRRGVPMSMVVEVRMPDGRRSVKKISRRFTGWTLVAGLFSYGIGALTYWELPEEIFVEVPPSSWDDPAAAEDLWMRPASPALKSQGW